MSRTFLGVLVLLVAGGVVLAYALRMNPRPAGRPTQNQSATSTPQNPSPTPSPETLHPRQASNAFWYVFNVDGTLEETGAPEESASQYWWLNSGGRFIISNLMGETMEGAASPADPWYQEYARTNPIDTDGGTHPQNLFRLVTRSSWPSASVRAFFYIAADNFSRSSNRNESNGLLLMSRYQDQGQTLYYAGLRVDGTAVIKKKYKGTYYTMAQKAVFPGTYRGTQDDINLIPHAEWISLKTDTVNEGGRVVVTLFMRRAGEKDWTQILTATDAGDYGNTPPLLAPGRIGIRTDFMDVRFRAFVIEPL